MGRYNAEKPSANEASHDRARRHRGQEDLVLGEDREALIAAVTRETYQHGGKAHGQRQAARKLDVTTEKQNERWYQQFAAGNAEQRSDDPDRKTCADPGGDLQRTSSSGRPEELASCSTSSMLAITTSSAAMTL
jgi:hypothetical protein